MKFDVSSSDLLKQLQIAGGVISSSPVLPILEDFLFTAEKGRLKIAATDLETSIKTELPVRTAEEGQVAVPARILIETLKALPEQPITFSVDEGTHAIEITSNYGKYKLAGENGQDFPRLPQPESVNSVALSSDVLTKGITKTLFAVSTDELRPSMTGIYFQVDGSKITLVATDAHKLVKYTFSNVEGEVTSSFIVPKKGLQLLKGALPTDEKVDLAFNNSNAFFTFGNIEVICRLIEAKYPDYNAVIPTDNPFLLTIQRVAFQNSLKRIAIYANKTTNQVVFSIKPGELTVSAQDLDFSNEATEKLACTYEGDDITIAFNAKFLVEMVNVLESDEVKMELSTPSRAGILLPAEKDENEDILMLVMPVMLSN